MGSIDPYKTASGTRYRARYRDPQRRQREKGGFRTKRDAREFLETVEVSKRSGMYLDPNDARATIGELAEPWLAAKRAVLKPSSFAPLEASWRNYVKPKWADVEVGQIRHSDVQAWVASIPMSATVVTRAFGILAGVLDVALRDRRISTNPARGVAKPKKRSRDRNRYLSHAELMRVADASGARAALVLTLGWCGLRWAELVELRVRDLDMLRRRIHVTRAAVEVDGVLHVDSTKGNKRRLVPMPRALVDLLAQQCAGRGRDDLLFDDGHGGHMKRIRTSAGNRSWLKSAFVAAGVEPMRLHELRHTAASLAVAAGANVKAIQRMLGHESAAMTLDVYADLFDDDLEALSSRLDDAIARAEVGRMWGHAVS